jgi:ribonuclease HII
MAKVSRDQLMIELDRIYPGYGLAQHKGYGTKKHFTCLYQLGPSPIHRQSFKPVKDIIEK